MKRLLTVFLLFSVVISFSIPFKPINVEAVGVDTAARVLTGSVGEKVLIAVAEKAGAKYATKAAAEKAVERWNLDLMEHLPIDATADAEKFAQLKSTDVIPIPDKPGFGKVVLSAAMFLTGADLLVDGVNAFMDGYNQHQFVERATDIGHQISNGERLTSVFGAVTYIDPHAWGGNWRYGIGGVFNNTNSVLLAGSDYASINFPVWIDIKSVEDVSATLSIIHFDYDATSANGRAFHDYGRELYVYLDMIKTPLPDYEKVAAVPTSADLPDYVPNDYIQPYIDSQTMPQDFPDTVSVIIPVGDLPDTLPDLNAPVAPVPDPYPDINTDPDGNPLPDPDPAPDVNGDPTNVPVDSGKCGQGLDTSKIKALGYNFTKTFPFSLPWDIYHAFKALFGGLSDGKPTWHFKFSTSLPVVGGNDFELTVPDYFDKWMPFVRGIILVSWNIGLVYAIRKWFGGAS